MGGRKIKGRNHSHEIFSVETGEAAAMRQFRSVSTRWHHSASVLFVVACFLIMGQLSVLADMPVPCGKLVWGRGGGDWDWIWMKVRRRQCGQEEKWEGVR